MHLPAHIIAVGPIEGNRMLLFSKLRLAGFRVHTHHVFVSADEIDRRSSTPQPARVFDDLATMKQVLQRREAPAKARWREIDIVDLEAVKVDVTFTTLLTGAVTPESVVEAAIAARTTALTVSPEERQWLEARGFVEDGFAWEIGNLRFVPTITKSFEARYPRDWFVQFDPELRRSDSYGYNVSIPNVFWHYQKMYPKYTGVTIDDEISFFDGLLPGEHKAWLDANGFVFQPGAKEVLFTKSVGSIDLHLHYYGIYGGTWKGTTSNRSAIGDAFLIEDQPTPETETKWLPHPQEAYAALMVAITDCVNLCEKYQDMRRQELARGDEIISQLREALGAGE